MPTELINVELLDEGVDVWAPVEAVAKGGGIYALPTTAPPDQRWALPPGSRVRCERRNDQIVAVAVVD